MAELTAAQGAGFRVEGAPYIAWKGAVCVY